MPRGGDDDRLGSRVVSTHGAGRVRGRREPTADPAHARAVVPHGLRHTAATLMLAEGWLAEEPDPTREEIREVVASNLCRCTGYQTIVDAVEDCAGRRRAALQARLEGARA